MIEREFEEYLALLRGLLRLRKTQCDAIADELRDHMDARLEDLLAEGIPRERAVQIALEEFGDAAGVGQAFLELNRTNQRRWNMKITAASLVTCTALGLAAMAFWPDSSNHLSNPVMAQAGPGGPGGGIPGMPPQQARTREENNAITAEILSRVSQDGIDIDNVPLGEAVQQMRDAMMSNLNVIFDKPKLEEGGVDTGSPITFRLLRGVRYDTMLELMLNSVNAGYYIHDGIVIITSKEALAAVTEVRVYNVADLVYLDTHWPLDPIPGHATGGMGGIGSMGGMGMGGMGSPGGGPPMAMPGGMGGYGGPGGYGGASGGGPTGGIGGPPGGVGGPGGFSGGIGGPPGGIGGPGGPPGGIGGPPGGGIGGPPGGIGGVGKGSPGGGASDFGPPPGGRGAPGKGGGKPGLAPGAGGLGGPGGPGSGGESGSAGSGESATPDGGGDSAGPGARASLNDGAFANTVLAQVGGMGGGMAGPGGGMAAGGGEGSAMAGGMMGMGGMGIADTRYFSKEPSAYTPEERRTIDLMRAITASVEFESWAAEGHGIGEIRPFEGLLVIRNTQKVHQGVEALLQQIRAARYQPRGSVGGTGGAGMGMMSLPGE